MKRGDVVRCRCRGAWTGETCEAGGCAALATCDACLEARAAPPRGGGGGGGGGGKGKGGRGGRGGQKPGARRLRDDDDDARRRLAYDAYEGLGGPKDHAEARRLWGLVASPDDGRDLRDSCYGEAHKLLPRSDVPARRGWA